MKKIIVAVGYFLLLTFIFPLSVKAITCTEEAPCCPDRSFTGSWTGGIGDGYNYTCNRAPAPGGVCPELPGGGSASSFTPSVFSSKSACEQWIEDAKKRCKEYYCCDSDGENCGSDPRFKISGTACTECKREGNPPTSNNPENPPSKSISIGDGGIADIIAGLGSIGDGLVPGCSPVTLGCVIALVVNKIVMPAAGLLLFLMIVWGGYKIVNGSFMGTQNSIDIGKRRILGAVLGFLLLSVVWWIWSLVEKVLGLSVVE